GCPLPRLRCSTPAPCARPRRGSGPPCWPPWRIHRRGGRARRAGRDGQARRRPWRRRGGERPLPLGHRWALCSVSMAGTWQRIKGIFQAKAIKALDKAEDPRDMLDLSYEQQLQQLQKIRRSVADVATARKRIELQAQGLQKQADKLQGQAKGALQQSNEDLAREALARRAALGEQLTDLKVQHDQIIEQEQKLVDTSQQLQ